MSVFHQLSGGKSGSGAGGGAPSTGTDTGHWASAPGPASKHKNAVSNTPAIFEGIASISLEHAGACRASPTPWRAVL
jgi:hypothetical protein